MAMSSFAEVKYPYKKSTSIIYTEWKETDKYLME